MDKQVEKKHYVINKYGDVSRFVSYFYQIANVINLNPKNLLEIGVGDKTVLNYFKNNTNINCVSLDIAEDLEPDIIASVEQIPLKDNSFDLILCAEVLEHLPFEQFEQNLEEIKRVTKKYAIISLPHFAPPVKFLLKIPFLPEIKFAFKIPFYKKYKFNGEHYWEIGKKNYTISKVRSIIRNKFLILKEFVPFENQYHHFFILQK